MAASPPICYIYYWMIFSWNRWNTEHIASHGVTPAEAEQIVEGARPPFPQPAGESKLKVWGQTESGRYLQVVFIFLDPADVDFDSLSAADLLDFMSEDVNVAYVIHAMDLTESMKRQFRRLRKRR